MKESPPTGCLPGQASGFARRDLRREIPAVSSPGFLESKLFGIGSEAFVVGSHEFYLGYAIEKTVFSFASTRGIFTPRNRSPTRCPPSSPSSPGWSST